MRNGDPFPAGVLERMRERSVTRNEDTAAMTRVIGELRLIMIDAQRVRLLELGHDGTFSSAELRHALAELDAEQLSLELRLADD